LVTLITPGQAGDSPMLLPLLQHLRVGRNVGRPRTRPDAVRGDKAYSSRAIRTHLRDRGIKAVIPEPDDQKGHRKRRGSCGGRPVGLDSADYQNRNVIEMMESRNRQVLWIASRAGSRGGLPGHLLSDAWTASFLVLVLTIVVSTAQ
jgi:hypothetical protein